MGRKKAAQRAPSVAESLPKEGEFSESPPERRKHLSSEEFWRAVETYPDKSAISIYVYRLWPRLVRKPPKQKNILKATSLTEDELRRKFGSGTYQVMLCDANRPRAGVRAKVEIDDPQLEPVIDPDDLDVGHPENRAYVEGLKARGLLPPESTDMGETTAIAVKEVAELARDAMKQHQQHRPESEANALINAAKVVAEIQERAAKSNQPPDVLAIIEKLQPIVQQRPEGGTADLIGKLIEQNNQLLMRLLERQNPADPLEQLEKAASILDRVGRRAGGGGGFDWSSLVNLVPAVLQGLAQLQARAAAASQAAAAPNPAVPSLPAADPVSLAAPEAAGQSADEQIPEAYMQALMTAGLTPAQINGLAKVGRLARESFERGVSGDDFAHALVSGVLMADGDAVYEVLEQIGQQQVAALLPQLGFRVAPERQADLNKFIADFFTYGQDDEGDKP